MPVLAKFSTVLGIHDPTGVPARPAELSHVIIRKKFVEMLPEIASEDLVRVGAISGGGHKSLLAFH
jgi:hypothetical protein